MFPRTSVNVRIWWSRTNTYILKTLRGFICEGVHVQTGLALAATHSGVILPLQCLTRVLCRDEEFFDERGTVNITRWFGTCKSRGHSVHCRNPRCIAHGFNVALVQPKSDRTLTIRILGEISEHRWSRATGSGTKMV